MIIDPQEINRLILDLKRQFDRFNAGEVLGRFKITGKGDGIRPAEAFDDARFLAHSANARSGLGELFVETTFNDYHRRGLLVIDFSPHNQWGGAEALQMRLDLMRAIAEGSAMLAAAQGHTIGAILPDGHTLRLIRTSAPLHHVVAEIHKTRDAQASLLEALKILEQQARHHEFAILVLSVHSLKNPEVRKAIETISKQCELVIIDVSDRWDWEMPDAGKVKLIQNGKAKRVDTSDGQTRKAYAELAEARERSTSDFVSAIGAQRHTLSTAEPFGAQFLSTFAPPTRRRAS